MKPIYLLFALSAINHAVLTGVRLATLLYAIQLGASPALVGVLAALFAAPAVFAAVPMGRWVDRRGARPPMLVAAVMMAAGSACAVVWHELGALFVVSILVGLFYNVFLVGSQQQIGRYSSPAERVDNFSMVMQAHSMANFVSPLITGFAIDNLGFTYAFLMLAAFPLLPLAAIGLNKLEIIPDPDLAARTAARAAAGEQARPRPSGNVFEILRPPVMRRIFAGAVLAFSALNLYNFLMPVYGTQIHLTAVQIGMILSSIAIGSVIVRGLAPALARRFTSWQLMIVSLVATAGGLAASSFSSNVGVLMALAFFLGLVMGSAAPVALALMHEASPPDRAGEVFGLRLSLLSSMQTMVPLAAGAIGGAVGVVPVFVAMALLILYGAFYMRGQWRTGA